MSLKKITSALCAYTLFATAVAYAAPSVEDKANMILLKAKESKQIIIDKKLEELNKIQSSVEGLKETIDRYQNNDVGPMQDLHFVSQFGNYLALASVVTIAIAGASKLKQALKWTGVAAVGFGIQAYVNNKVTKITKAKYDHLQEASIELEKILNNLEENQLDPEKVRSIQKEIKKLKEEQVQFISENGDDYVLLSANILSSLYNVTMFIYSTVFLALVVRMDPSKLQILSGIGLVIGSALGLTINSESFSLAYTSEDMNELYSELDEVSIKLESLSKKLQTIQ